MIIKYKEVKLTPRQQASHTYKFHCAELSDGLNYHVAPELANQSLEAIGSTIKFDKSPTNREFCETFWKEWQRIETEK